MVRDVSSRKRLLQVVMAVLFNLCSAGVIFGFAALKPVLVKEGVYAELCSKDDGEDRRRGLPCDAQDLQMNFMFTLATVVTNVAALPIGTLMDKIGPKATTLAGAATFFLGNIVFPMNSKIIDTYFVGYVLLAIGGPLIFLPSFHLSNTFPLQAGLILSCITGAFDASSIPYLLYDTIYEKFGAISLRTFFWCYSVIPILLVVEQLTIAPGEAYQRHDFMETKAYLRIDTDSATVASGGGADSPTVVGSSQNSLSDMESAPLKHVDESGDKVVGAMFGRSAGQQICSPWFCAIVFFLCIYMARINYLIQTIAAQLVFYLEDPDLARSTTTAFTVLLPLGGIVGIPFVGWLLDSRTTLYGSNVVLFMGVAFGIFGMIPHVAAYMLSIAIFVILRPLMYTFVGDYCGKIFGFEHFGAVYGLANSLSGAFGLVLRPVDIFVKVTLGGNYTPVNVATLTIGFVASSALSMTIWRGSRGINLD